MKKKIFYFLQKLIGLIMNKPIIPDGKVSGYSILKSQKANFKASEKVKYEAPFFFSDVEVGDYTILKNNVVINNTVIGKFSSIGAGFMCGMGIHPTNGISTNAMFYSTSGINGYSLVTETKIVENKQVVIGNDVYIGINVTILDGVTIGDGAMIGAGAVVTKDIAPYAIAVGVPAKVVKYRFEQNQIEKLLKIKWWNFADEKLQEVEKYFFDIDLFIERSSANIDN